MVTTGECHVFRGIREGRLRGLRPVAYDVAAPEVEREALPHLAELPDERIPPDPAFIRGHHLRDPDPDAAVGRFLDLEREPDVALVGRGGVAAVAEVDFEGEADAFDDAVPVAGEGFGEGDGFLFGARECKQGCQQQDGFLHDGRCFCKYRQNLLNRNKFFSFLCESVCPLRAGDLRGRTKKRTFAPDQKASV